MGMDTNKLSSMGIIEDVTPRGQHNSVQGLKKYRGLKYLKPNKAKTRTVIWIQFVVQMTIIATTGSIN